MLSCSLRASGAIILAIMASVRAIVVGSDIFREGAAEVVEGVVVEVHTWRSGWPAHVDWMPFEVRRSQHPIWSRRPAVRASRCPTLRWLRPGIWACAGGRAAARSLQALCMECTKMV